jgi:predicted DNA-binding transcriptional regulator YafY
MPSNKHAAFRYRVINQCLTRSSHPKWTLEELLEEVNAHLQESFGHSAKIGKRSIQGDIQLMRSDPPCGYAAPIAVKNGQYFYSEPGYSIHTIPLSDQEMGVLKEALALLEQFPGLPQQPPLKALLDRFDPQGTPLPEVIQFEINERTAGLKWIAPAYSAIVQQHTLRIRYQSFQVTTPTQLVLHPYLLKEWRNRWYLLGLRHDKQRIWNLALDRIQEMEVSIQPFQRNTVFDPRDWFKDVIGVTRMVDSVVQEVVFRTHPRIAGYLITKPLHDSQAIVRQDETGTVFSLQVITNFELLAELLRYGNDLEVLSPAGFRAEWLDKWVRDGG